MLLCRITSNVGGYCLKEVINENENKKGIARSYNVLWALHIVKNTHNTQTHTHALGANVGNGKYGSKAIKATERKKEEETDCWQ